MFTNKKETAVQKTPLSALFSSLAALHFFARSIITNTDFIILKRELIITSVIFVILLMSLLTDKKLDYWMIGAAAILCGIYIAVYVLTQNFLFVWIAAIITLNIPVLALSRNLDKRIGNAGLLCGYMTVTYLSYLLVLS